MGGGKILQQEQRPIRIVVETNDLRQEISDKLRAPTMLGAHPTGRERRRPDLRKGGRAIGERDDPALGGRVASLDPHPSGGLAMSELRDAGSKQRVHHGARLLR